MAEIVGSQQAAGPGSVDVRRGVLLVPLFVVLSDWLFYGQPLGWTIGLYGGLLVAALVATSGGLRAGGWPVWLLGLGLLGLCVRCVCEPNLPTLALGTLGLASLALALREGWHDNALVWVCRWGRFVVGWVAALLAVPLAALGALVAGIDGGSRTKLLRAWLIPLGLGAVFVALFAGANPLIANALSSVWNALSTLWQTLPSLPSLWRVAFWLAVAAGVWVLLSFRARVQDSGLLDVEGGAAADWAGFLTPAVVRRALVVFNLVFAVQTAMDLWFLWGGAALPQGLTYAQYAHRGAYPLVATALLAAAFVLITFRPGPPLPESRTSHRLVYAWLAQNVFLMVSAGWRLWLYVNAYSLTRWRMAAAVWMLLVAGGLLWILVRLLTARSNLWLINVNGLTALAVLYGCAWTGIDPWVARFNVRHCEELGIPDAPAVDLRYLRRLGYDSIPALLWLQQHSADPGKAYRAAQVANELADDLNRDLDNWRGWTRRRAGIRAALALAPPVAAPLSEVAAPPEPEDQLADGRVLSVTGNRVLVRVFNGGADKDTATLFLATPRTTYDNLSRLSELRAGDPVVLGYIEQHGQRVLTAVVRAEVEPEPAVAVSAEGVPATVPPAVPPPAVPAPAPAAALPSPTAVTPSPASGVPAPPPAPAAAAPAVPGPVLGRATGQVVSVTPGSVTIEVRDASGAVSGVGYSITRSAELRGLGSLAELQARETVSVEYTEKAGRRWITVLTRGRVPKPSPAP